MVVVVHNSARSTHTITRVVISTVPPTIWTPTPPFDNAIPPGGSREFEVMLGHYHVTVTYDDGAERGTDVDFAPPGATGTEFTG